LLSPAGEAKPDVCVISDGEAGAYYTVGLVLSGGRGLQTVSRKGLIKTINKKGGGVISVIVEPVSQKTR
jgi:hypothetical protein